MTDLIEVAELRKYLRQLYAGSPVNQMMDIRILDHFSGVGETAANVVKEIVVNNPLLEDSLDVGEIAIAGELHDVGRLLSLDQTFHEPRGANWIIDYGLQVGISSSVDELKRLALMIRSHSVVAEQWADERNELPRREIGNYTAKMLTPETWQQAIITYADMTFSGGGIKPYRERIAALMHRCESDPKYLASNPTLLDALVKGRDRLYDLCEKIESLRKGRMERAKGIEIEMAFGFI